ncbi:MAG: hypothetical protein ABI277_04555 [Burkholderiaceae bacterium]
MPATLVLLSCLAVAHAQSDAVGDTTPGEATGTFSVAVIGSAGEETERETAEALRAIDGTGARFVVHFDLSKPSDVSCSDASLERRRRLLDASAKPVVPVVAASEWADCKGVSDPLERLSRIGDTLFDGDDSLGQTRLQWLRQTAVPRFHRYRENLRWQIGRVLFMTLNLPDNNNNFRIGAGRNGEFDERAIANRAWLERSFRVATERRLAGVVLFVDAAPRFAMQMRSPDVRSRERDGYYEWKLAMRDVMASYKGQVLLVQAHRAATPEVPRRDESEHPLHDAANRPVENLRRVAFVDRAGPMQWMRIDIDDSSARVFGVRSERAFDDPSGELYGPARPR